MLFYLHRELHRSLKRRRYSAVLMAIINTLFESIFSSVNQVLPLTGPLNIVIKHWPGFSRIGARRKRQIKRKKLSANLQSGVFTVFLARSLTSNIVLAGLNYTFRLIFNHFKSGLYKFTQLKNSLNILINKRSFDTANKCIN